MAAEENKEVIRRLCNVINEGNFDQLDEILAPHYVRHDPNPLLKNAGREEYKKAFTAFRRAFPDAQWTLEDLLADGDRVIGRWTFRGTHLGAFFNIPPGGQQVSYPILAIYRIENGMIAEDWHIFHSIGLWQKLIPQIENLIEQAVS